MQVAVAKTKFMPAVEGAKDDWRDLNSRNVRASFEVMDLNEAISKTYDTDAHLVTYIMKMPDGTPLKCQPRIAKEGLRYVLSQGYLVESQVIFLDIDNENHERWTPEAEKQAIDKYHQWDAQGIRTWGIYHTGKGARFVQPLENPIPVEQFEGYIFAFRKRIESLGVIVDKQCKDWTRHFRLPNVFRDGKRYKSTFIG